MVRDAGIVGCITSISPEFHGFARRERGSADGVKLARETVVGLPRTNLVQPQLPSLEPGAPGAPVAPYAASLAVPNPFDAAAAGRDPFRTNADSVDIEMESQRAPETQRDAAPAFAATEPCAEPLRGPYASAISTHELLERAAAMGPARMTWESIVLEADPILSEKRQPHVAERRQRLTRVVKMTLGACVAVCAMAVGVSALSGGSSASSPTAAGPSVGKTVASKGIVPVEPLDGTKHGKAVRHVAPSVTTAAFVRPKHR